MEWLQKTWGRWATAVAVLCSAAVVFSAPGGSVFIIDLAYNIVRAFAALVMFEALLRYSTRKIGEAIDAVPVAPGGSTGVGFVGGLRFADIFMVMFSHPVALAIFIGAGMVARAIIVWAVWK